MSTDELLLAEYEKWQTPYQALARAMQSMAPDAASAAIWQRVVGGAIRAVAKTTSEAMKDTTPYVFYVPKLIPPAYWGDLVVKNGGDFWSGDALFVIVRNRHVLNVRCFQIRLDPVALEATLPPRIPGLPEALTKKPEEVAVAITSPVTLPPDPTPMAPPVAFASKSGAPRKEFWDDLFIEIFRQLWLGALTPKRAADVERAMLTWADGKGFKLSETSVKKPARKLFDAWSEEGQK